MDIFFIKIRFSLFEFSNKILIKIKGKLNKKRYLLNNEYLFKNTNKKLLKKIKYACRKIKIAKFCHLLSSIIFCALKISIINGQT